MDLAEAKSSDFVHMGFPAFEMPSNLKQEANSGLTKGQETSEALINTGHIKRG